MVRFWNILLHCDWILDIVEVHFVMWLFAVVRQICGDVQVLVGACVLGVAGVVVGERE